MSIISVLNQGYFYNHRLWSLIDEMKARDLEHFSLALDASNADENYRRNIDQWLKSRQPRRHPREEIPSSVLDRIAKAFNNG